MADRARPALPLELLDGRLAVCRLPADAPVPSWAAAPSRFLTVSRTPDELSLTLDEALVPDDVRAERGWRAFRVRGPLPFHLVGILASLLEPLADAGLGIFAVSTFDTDYVLVKDADLASARTALAGAGHVVTGAEA